MNFIDCYSQSLVIIKCKQRKTYTKSTPKVKEKTFFRNIDLSQPKQ